MVNIYIPKTVYSHSAGRYLSGRDLERENKRNHIVNPLDVKDHPLTVMNKDRTMVSMIRNGRGSDKGLMREAEQICREREAKRKEKARAKDQRELSEMKQKYGIK